MFPTLPPVPGRGGEAGQQLDGVLGPHADGAVQLPLQHAAVVLLRGRHHLPHVADKLLPLHQLDTGIHLGIGRN